MPELESVIEQNLIKQLCSGESQWTYCPELRTENDLWNNFKYILEQNNKDKLNDVPLSESEFAQVKNSMSHASFYEAGQFISGENGKVYVHVQRGNEKLHLLVLNNAHICGGTSVYQVINQYQAFKTAEDDKDRRFDVTLLINGIPLIHIELKSRAHAYMEGFRQIKKYISEGKFHGLFSNVQMFVVSNAVDTKYFSPARDTELNEKFLTGWLNEDNTPVHNYLEFAQKVLKVPEAHFMVTKYTVLDKESKRLLLLRPYQIHAIEAMEKASKKNESGFIWHTTGSGKTMTSYKATRNLLLDIPGLDKVIFLIDRKDLDNQTTAAFQSYANNDSIDVDGTDNVEDLKKELLNLNDRKAIVTTRQKMQILISNRLKEGTSDYDKIKSLRIAFVVDECHRAVTPETKRLLERFFSKSLWYGFTGTPRFKENGYEAKGDLPQTTEQLYGRQLHSYTIKEAIHDKAVLGFMVECLGPKGEPDEDLSIYDTEDHMRAVLDVILNKSYAKFGMQKGKGRAYEAILTVNSIPKAQRYYSYLKKVVAGQDKLKISEAVRSSMPDFPKFAITYSVTENDESSMVNQDRMKESLKDYNEMFGTSYGMENINAYNENLNKRLARKEKRFLERSEQLDLVIVVDRLLTGFDAPCLSTLFMDRQPMAPHNLIQAFSRTNRLFDNEKKFGYIVTFQSHKQFKEDIDHAISLYSRGGDGEPLSEDFDTVHAAFKVSLKSVRNMGTPDEVTSLSTNQKKAFLHLFKDLDMNFAHLKAFSNYTESLIEEVNFTEDEYEDYAAVYKNIIEELKAGRDGGGDDPDVNPIGDEDYELIAYSRLKIDFEYIVQLLQGFVDSMSEKDANDDEFEERAKEIREMIDGFAKDNPKLGDILYEILDDIEKDRESFLGKDISEIVNKVRYEAIDSEIKKFSKKWYIDPDVVSFEAYNFRNRVIKYENKLVDSADYTAYRENTDNPVPKFKFRKVLRDDFKDGLMAEIEPLFG